MIALRRLTPLIGNAVRPVRPLGRPTLPDHAKKAEEHRSPLAGGTVNQDLSMGVPFQGDEEVQEFRFGWRVESNGPPGLA
jgi:hypothetical protein